MGLVRDRHSRWRPILSKNFEGGKGSDGSRILHSTVCVSHGPGPSREVHKAKIEQHSAPQALHPGTGAFSTAGISFSVSHKGTISYLCDNLSTHRTACLDEASVSNLHKGKDGLVMALNRKRAFL